MSTMASDMDGAPRTIAVGLLWHTHASGNQGVNALTVSNVAMVRSAAAAIGLVPRFTYFEPGYGTQLITTENGDQVLGINRRSMLTGAAYWKALGTLDCMIDISAGDSFADIYGARRFAWMWATKRLAILRGIPLLLAPQTIGPFTRQPYRLLAGGIMRRAALTVARDPCLLTPWEICRQGRGGCCRPMSRSGCPTRVARPAATAGSTSA